MFDFRTGPLSLRKKIVIPDRSFRKEIEGQKFKKYANLKIFLKNSLTNLHYDPRE